MKKQFLRVKQIADQTIFKAEKSEALNHKELQLAEHKVEYLRCSLNNIIKRLPLNQLSEGNIEKRMKKYSEYLLGQSLQDQNQRNIESECKLLQGILKECAAVEFELAKEQAEHESKVEQLVSAPLQIVVENDLPNIIKHKRNLNKYILDKDSASNRYHSSKNGNNKEALKDNMEEADIKVEQYRDVLAAEMFNLLRKESEIAQHILQLLKLQRGYHESALKNLEKVIPALEQRIGDSPVKAVFGLNLEEHLRVSNRKLAYPLELCICALTELGMSEEGLFRVVGAASRVKRLKLAIDSGCFSLPLIPEYMDVHVLASTLKSYLRDLPEPLLTYHLYNDWIEVMQYAAEERVAVLQQIIKRLPQPNKDNLTYLIQFYAKLAKNLENKMTSSNIAIVIAPNLLWSQNKEMDMHMENFSIINMVVELFISNVQVLFPDNVDNYLSIQPSELLAEEQEFTRPVLSNVKLINHEANDYISAPYQPDSHTHDTSSSSSPKPQMRRKTKLAPPVPTNKNDIEFNDRVNISPSYPSGSTTLNRSHKTKATTEAKSALLNFSNPEDIPNPRRQSLIVDSSNTAIIQNDVPKPALVSLDDIEVIEAMTVSQPASNIQVTKAKPIQHVAAQTINFDKINITTNNLQTKVNCSPQYTESKIASKPVAAPRSSLICDNHKPPLDTSRVIKNDLMSRSLDEIDVEGELIQIRKPFNDNINERSHKPIVPTRPASLKAAPRTFTTSETVDPTLQRTCQLYSVANKQQPSFVNIQNKNVEKFLAGHDTQMAEKEKFLGHNLVDKTASKPSVENKCGDVNFNYSEVARNRTSSVGSQNKPEVPPKSSILKSNEKLDLNLPEKLNGNSKPSHTRTQSDGNITDVINLVQTPPSPRMLSKPTQPPPPPPVTANRPKNEGDSTDL